MEINHTLEVEKTIHDIEERAERNRLGMQVTAQVAEYRAHGAKQDVETLLAVVNAVLDELVHGDHVLGAESVLAVMYGALREEDAAK